ncbi:MAG: DUF4175 family protein [Gemmatimonadetes bacterium]|nr:DUF4175 family protein [Gemmatimonadota bacterium]
MARSGYGRGSDAHGDEIRRILRSVRGRWRLRILLRGLAFTLGAAAVAFLASAWAMELLRFSPGAVTGLRWAAWGAVAAVAAVTLIRPLLRRVSDERVALYLEEREPSLEAAILGAVQVGRGADGVSPELVDGLVRRAVERARAVEDGRRIERRALYRSSGVLGGVAVGSLGVLLLLPPAVRHGVSALLNPTIDAATVNPYAVSVTPGDVTVARGADQRITAELTGFSAEDVTLFTRGGEGEAFGRLSMLPMEDGGFELLLLDLQDVTDYFVESDGVRSPTHRITVADLPYVGRMDHELRFPSWARLPPRVVEDGGDVAALRGTEVRLTVHPTLPTTAGRVLLDQDTLNLAAGGEGTLTGSFRVDAPGFYRIELATADGAFVEASPAWAIDVLQDQPPSVSFTRPGRDQPASPIEEVYLEAEALDDYGIAELLLVTSVNGGAEDTLSLFGGTPLREVSAGHTLYLEEHELEPGDVVSYYAVARDQNGAGGRVVASDLYFLEIRPFGVEYRQADQQGGGMGGMGGGESPETALSELQKQVIAATFNLQRDRDRYGDEELSENTVSVGLAQGRVRQQVETLVERMGNRGLADAEPRFREIAGMLPRAVEEMRAAEAALEAGELVEALGPEQRALQILRHAEETYERYVAMQQQGGGGGGGGGANADDLADLFELELDKLRNQYETVQRGEQRQADAGVDEVLERLKELARRQQQELERQRRAASQQGAGGGGGDTQRALAEETEELARQLERLARDSGDRDMEQTARDLQRTADAMRESAASAGGAGTSRAGAAADRLEEARRQLERSRSNRLQRDADDALERARRLARQQREVRENVRTLEDEDDDAARARRIQDVQERKTSMAEEVADLERQLDRMAAEALRDGQRQAAREASEAAETIRERKIKEKLSFSRGVVEQRGVEEYARRFEAEIGMDLDALEESVREAGEAVEARGPDPMEEALDRARSLTRGAESLERRLRERTGSGEGEEGEPGQAAGGDPADGDPAGEGEAGGGAGGGQDSREGRPGGARESDGVPGGGATRGSPTGLSPEEIRQFRSEFRQRAAEARELRDGLREAGQDAADLDQVIESMERLAESRPYGDPADLERLQASIREGLQRVEFRLRREVEGDARERAVLRGSDDVPEGFRRLVEEYFRALAREGSPGGG